MGHLLIALGTEAAMAGFRVRYVLATKLVNELVEAADEKIPAKTIARYGRVDLLCIDELGHMELDKTRSVGPASMTHTANRAGIDDARPTSMASDTRHSGPAVQVAGGRW